MRTRLAAIAAAALVAGGCGSGGGSATGGDSAASVVPATAPVFVSLDQRRLRNVDEVLTRFPIRDRVLTEVRKAVREYGLVFPRSAGNRIDVAVLDEQTERAAAFAKPPDAERLDHDLDRAKLVHRRQNGWTVYARDQEALDAVEHADAKLADVPAFRKATEKLPADAGATAYVARRLLQEDAKGARWGSAALLSHDDGLVLQVHVNAPGQPGTESYDPDLVDAIPDGSVAALSFRSLGDALRTLKPATVPFFGVRVDELASAFDGEGVLYVRPGAFIPEVTLVTEGGSGAAALDRTVRALVPAGSTPTRRTIEGVTVNELALGPVALLYGAVDGKLVVTDNANAIRGVKTGDRPKLTDDDPTFKGIRDAANMPEKTNGWLYLNVEDGLPLVEAVAQLANQKIPKVWAENLRPLRAVLVYGTRTGDTQTLVAFAQT